MKSLFCAIFLTASSVLLSQYDKNISFFNSQMNIVNPAFAGHIEGTSFSLISRNQWVSIEDAPKSQIFTFSSSRKKNVGLGLSIFSKQNYVEKFNDANIDFSYKLDLNENTRLFLGLKGVLNFFKSDISSFSNSSNFVDPALVSISNFNPNLGLGFLLNSKKYWFSLSIPKLFTSVSNETFISQNSIVTYVGAGSKFKINDTYQLKPNILFRNSKNQKAIFDFSVLLGFKEFFDFGALYRSNGAIGLLSKFNLKGAEIGYAYETISNSLAGALNLNTHELFIKFTMNRNKDVQAVLDE
jgi:type IX secretion system PorP/SprF family membrane protein